MSHLLADHRDRTTALEDFQHNLVVTAGAGTGKTSLLTGRVLTALLGKQLAPASVLVTTFTEKAAAEMAERVEGALAELAEGAVNAESDAGRALSVLRESFGRDQDSIARDAAALLDGELPPIETFHAFCLRTLCENAREAALPPDAHIAEDLDTDELFDEFWLSLADSELSGHCTQPILDEDAWHALLSALGIDEIKSALRSWCRRPQLALYRFDTSIDESLDRLTSVVQELEELVSDHPQPKAFQRDTLPALTGARALIDGATPTDLSGCRRFVDLGSKRPKISTTTPEPDRTRMGETQRALQKLLEAVIDPPDPKVAESLDRLCREAGRRFATLAASRSFLSFDDCLVRCFELLRDKPGLRTQLAERHAQILVDEFQDTDPLQCDILFYLAQGGSAVAGERPRDVELRRGVLCIVGDPKQSIYRFRGADMEAYEQAMSTVIAQDGQQLHLTVNFRSDAGVLDLVNAAVGPAFDPDPGFQPPYEELVASPDAATAAMSTAAMPTAAMPTAAARLLHVLPGDAPRRGHAEHPRLAARALARDVLCRVRASEGRFGDFALLFRSFQDAEIYAREFRQLAVPVLVEGGKRFYERHEVERFLAVLQTVVRPHDEAATLAFLRGPLGAVPDADIAAAVEVGKSPARLFTYAAEALAGLPETLQRAAQTHSELRAATRDLAPAEVLRFCLHRTMLAAIEAAGYDGAQRLANLEILAQRLAHWTGDGRRGLAEAVDRLAREARLQVEAGESPLADSETDAVRLMTIHKAKGLEFEHVIVPDIGRRTGETSIKSGFHVYGDRVLAAIGGLRSPALPLAEERLRRHETAEELRLLYVVLTRARRSVTLSTTRVPTNSSPWKRVLDGLGLDLKARPEDGTEFRGGLVYRTANDDDVELGATDRDVDEGDLIAAVQRRRKWRDRVRSSMRQDLEAPSRIDGVAPEPTIQSPTRFPLAVGATVHDYLRSHDLSSNELDLDRLTALADVVSADLPEVGTRQRLIDQSAELLTDFLDSDLFARLKAAKVLGRELPVLWTDATGRRWHGSIDIVFEEDEIVVGDFKTDRVEGGIEQLGGRYRAQLTGYATALERAWSLAKPPRAELLLLRAARALRVT